MKPVVVAYVVFATTAGYCYGCPPPEEEPPYVAQIQILPSEISASPGTAFTVRARLVDEWGNAYPDERAVSLEWRAIGSGTTLIVDPPAKGPSAIVRVPTGGPFPPLSLVAELEGYEQASMIVYTSAAGISPSNADLIRANHNDGDPPALALIDGFTAEELLSDSLFAFIRRGTLDYLDCPLTANCGEITIFSRTQGLVRQSGVTWTSSCDDVDLTGGPSVAACTGANAVPVIVPPLQKIPVRYVLRASATSGSSSSSELAEVSPASDVGKIVEADVDYARKVLANSWTGLDLARVTDPPEAEFTTMVSVAVRKPDPCLEQAIPVGVQLGVDPDPKTITVAYVEEIVELDGDEMISARGFACPWNATFGSIILISWSLWAPTTLVHELAHALGPWQTYPWGHTEGQPGFNESNVLWDFEADSKPGPRSLISLGQAFRLSLDANSFFRRGVPTTLPNCQFYFTPDAPDTPCPRLSRDVVRP